MVAGTEVEVRAGGVVFRGQSTRFCFFLTERRPRGGYFTSLLLTSHDSVGRKTPRFAGFS